MLGELGASSGTPCLGGFSLAEDSVLFSLQCTHKSCLMASHQTRLSSKVRESQDVMRWSAPALVVTTNNLIRRKR
jgi:hypothetical protein